MSIHNISFYGEIRKNIIVIGRKNSPYLDFMKTQENGSKGLCGICCECGSHGEAIEECIDEDCIDIL